MGFLPDRDIGAKGTNVSLKGLHRQAFQTYPPCRVLCGIRGRNARMGFLPDQTYPPCRVLCGIRQKVCAVSYTQTLRTPDR